MTFSKIDIRPLIVLIFLLTSIGYMFAIIEGAFVFDSINIIVIGTIALFLFVTYLSIKRTKYLSLFLPFVFIAFPTIINNVFPGVYLEDERLSVIYPIFSHIEIFLIIILFFKLNGTNSKINWSVSFLFFLLCISFIISTFVNICCSETISEVCLLLTGLYPVRLAILIYLVINNINIDFEFFIKGIGLSILFLFIESSVYSTLTHTGAISSGSLAVNTFGNVMGQLSCVLLCYLIVKKHFDIKLFLISLIGIVAVILSNTRMAILSSLIVIVLILLPLMNRKNRLVLIILLFIGLLSIGGSEIYEIFISNEKFDVSQTFNSIHIRNGQIDIDKGVTTMSLLTRLDLWQTSLNMIKENPVFGIGWNTFNIKKYDYGFSEYVIIDPHNGYLSSFCQLGIFGLLWIYFLYIRAYKYFFKAKNKNILILTIFNIGISICEFTNAGSYKYNVLSLLLFVAIIIDVNYNRKLV